jgi:hypothetical protein
MELKKIEKTDNNVMRVMIFNGEHVIYRNVDGQHFIGMATIFNEIYVKNLLDYEYRTLSELKPNEKPKPWVDTLGTLFRQMPKEIFNQFIVN